MKFMKPRMHGPIDYLAVVLLLLAPTIFGFGGIAATIAYVAGAAQLVMSLLTAYPMGLKKVIPFTVHGGVEVVTAILFVASPWIFGFAHVDAARNFFLAAGIGLGLVFLVTDYKAADVEYGRGTGGGPGGGWGARQPSYR